VLVALDGEFTTLYADSGRPSIAPERLLRALLLQVFYTIRSERQLIEQLHYNFLYRWCRRCSRRTGNCCSRRASRTSSWLSY
jgi:transposase